jgi:hypothetical protein
MRSKLVWLMMFLGAFFAPVLRYFQRRDEKRHGEELKAKVAEVKAVQAERKEKTDAAVAQVDEAAKVDAAKDPVALANDLIRDAGKS